MPSIPTGFNRLHINPLQTGAAPASTAASASSSVTRITPDSPVSKAERTPSQELSGSALLSKLVLDAISEIDPSED